MRIKSVFFGLVVVIIMTACESGPTKTIDNQPLESTSTKADNKQHLELTLSLDKKTYHIGESVQVTLKLINLSEKDLLVNGRLGFVRGPTPAFINAGTILVWDPFGNYIVNNVIGDIQSFPKEEDFIILSPGNSVTRSFYIQDSTGYKDIGSYTVIAIYRNSFNPGDVYNSKDTREAWKGDIISNIVTFNLQP